MRFSIIAIGIGVLSLYAVATANALSGHGAPNARSVSEAKISATQHSELFLDAPAFSPNADGRRDNLTGFILVTGVGHLIVTVRNTATGAIVATLYDESAYPGFIELVWNGFNADAVVPDGRYSVRAEFTSAGSLTPDVMERPVDVDTAAPPLVATSLRSVLRWNSTIAPLQVTNNEPVQLEVDVTSGSAHRTLAYVVDAGTHKLAGLIPVAARKRTRSGSSAQLTIRVRAMDASLNLGEWQSLNAYMPAKPAPSAPDPGTDPTVPDTPTGTVAIHWPLSGPITSPFGQRNGRLHAGIDIGVPSGRKIRAAAGGVVTTAGWYGGYGKCVIVKHRGGWSTLYAHQSRIAVKVGKKLKRGALVGYVGSTGHSTGPHLHFETRKNSRPLNPLLRLP